MITHGFDPADFDEAFSFDDFLNRPARKGRTGRERVMVVGTWFGGPIVTCILSPLGTEACDVLSVRPASRKERAAYGET